MPGILEVVFQAQEFFTSPSLTQAKKDVQGVAESPNLTKNLNENSAASRKQIAMKHF